MSNKKSFWVSIGLLNLVLVSLLGIALRSKILFSIPFINYKNLLSAHSHFAFGGWAALTLITLLIYDLLPQRVSNRKIYQWILWGIQISSLGMAFTFPFTGYALLSIIFSTLHLLVTYLFAIVFIGDLVRSNGEKSIAWLSITAVISLVVSSAGPLGLAYSMITKSGGANFHRDCVYAFLHFQYNGFFTLSILALYFNRWARSAESINSGMRKFAVIMCLSILPTLFLSLLWHNHFLLYVIAGIGCLLIILSLFLFVKIFYQAWQKPPFINKLARILFVLSFLSFTFKTILQIGPIIPGLGDAVYGDRPLIIGFLHLVFLGFLSLYILSSFTETGYFNRKGKTIAYPIIIFTIGVIANETILMLQGLGILLNANYPIYNWLLWINSMILVVGAALMSMKKSKNQEPEERTKIQDPRPNGFGRAGK